MERQRGIGLMGLNAQSQHSLALMLNEQTGKKKRHKWAEAIRPWIHKALMLWVILTLLTTMMAYYGIDARFKQARKETLVSMCNQRARILQDQFNVSVNHVHALAILISTFHYLKNPSAIDQQTFADYTARTAFERPLLSGVAYAERVVNSERNEFERHHGWTIKTMDGDPSPVRDEYAPVILNQETVSYIRSLDMMSGQEDRENILKARATGSAVLTRPFRLLDSHHLGIVLTFPVYKSKLPPYQTDEERINATAGYIGGSFDVESLVKNLLGQLAGDQEIVVNVYDTTKSSEHLIMYGNQTQDGDMSLLHVSMLGFGDPSRKHQMVCRYHQKEPTWMVLQMIPILWCMIGLLVGYLMYITANHVVKVEDDFHAMEELKVRAEAADVAKSQFLATVSHEIRTPMNGLIGMLAMLLDTGLSSTQSEHAQTAQVCGRALVTLIDELLDRAKIEAGKLELEEIPFNLRSIMDDVLSLFSEKSRHMGVELAVFVSDKVPETVKGDPGRFRQIITNLVGNSVKFTKRGHIFVQVHLAEHVNAVMGRKAENCLNDKSDEGAAVSGSSQFKTLSGCEAADDRSSWDTFKQLIAYEELNSDGSNGVATGETCGNVSLVVCVEDTGIGIPFQAQERVFAPFMQADSSTSRNFGGTGIGLSISKCLVELMGGRISFVSRPGVGSTFSFTVDFRRCDHKSLAFVKKSLPNDLPTLFKGLRAIVVDPKPVRAVVTRYHLKRLGILVEVVDSIGIAIAKCEVTGSLTAKLPDMILVEKDSWIDGDDGCFNAQLLEWKHSRPTCEFPKLILLAANPGSMDLETVKAAGFTGTIIMKPSRASMVAAYLHQVLGTEKKWEQGKDMDDRSALLCDRKILVVDDNLVNRRVAEGALKKFGADVECVDSGKAALEKLKLPHCFAACFMDIQMPDMDGFQATRKIREMELEANVKVRKEAMAEEGEGGGEWHVPILAMTADVVHATYDQCLKCGMDGYVSKPFDQENLYQAVANLLKSKPPTAYLQEDSSSSIVEG